jgi:hypothetical protein
MEDNTFECGRCGTGFAMTANHTEIVRRDFVDVPRPARIERLCRGCWRSYVEQFLDRDFDAVLDTYLVDN